MEWGGEERRDDDEDKGAREGPAERIEAPPPPPLPPPPPAPSPAAPSLLVSLPVAPLQGDILIKKLYDLITSQLPRHSCGQSSCKSPYLGTTRINRLLATVTRLISIYLRNYFSRFSSMRKIRRDFSEISSPRACSIFQRIKEAGRIGSWREERLEEETRHLG